MISSVIGAVIMSAATVAMLLTLEFTNKMTKEFGKNVLSEDEENIIRNANFPDPDKAINSINIEIINLPFEE